MTPGFMKIAHFCQSFLRNLHFVGAFSWLDISPCFFLSFFSLLLPFGMGVCSLIKAHFRRVQGSNS